MIRIAKTENGMVKGLPAADPRITAFKGIPFAAPPVGENRWRAPLPAKDWDGVKEAYAFAPISMQDVPGLGTDIYCREWHVDSEIPMDEDCLYLNVWTNAKSTEDKLPVLVWFFGGGFQWGYTAEMEFDGARIARRGVVVVTVNYRLAAFGFLAHPELTKTQPEGFTNFGSLDQQAGLHWVKRNIAAFGGDPENITVAGQSAGGASVLIQMAAEGNEGAFQKAAVLSGMFRGPYGQDAFMKGASLEEAEKKGEAFFSFLGVENLEEARKLDASFIRDKYAEFAGFEDMSKRFAPIQDGLFLKKQPYESFYHGRGLRVPVMAGNTMDEFFKEVNGERINDIEYGVKAAFLAEEKREDRRDCYYYLFDGDIPGEDKPGSFHSVDLWFFFETLASCSRPYSGRDYDLARKMCNYWVNFMKTGDPNGGKKEGEWVDSDGRVLPEWKPYTQKTPCQMIFRTDGILTKDMEEESKKILLDKICKEENAQETKR